MIKNRVRSPQLLAGLAIFVASFGLYLSTLAPTLTWGWNDLGVDGGELLAAANTLGIPHPPGYPTYTLLLKSFATLVPVGDFAYRGNLLSALLASATVFTLYWATLRLCRFLKPEAPSWLAISGAAFGSAVLGAAPMFWSQAVITEVYTLNALFAAALLLIATRLALPAYLDGTDGRTSPAAGIGLFGLLLGLGLGNHLTLLAVAVPLLFWLWMATGWRAVVSPWLAVGFVAGVSVYAYLPLRAIHGPPINWGDTGTPGGLVWMLTGTPYREYVFGVDPGNFLDRLGLWVELVFSQFNPLGMFMGLMGAASLRSRTPWFLAGASGTIVVISVYAVTYNTVDFEVLMIPAFLLFSVWAGVGFFWIVTSWAEAAESARGSRIWRVLRVRSAHQAMALTLLAFLLVPGTSVALNYGSQDLRNDRRAYEHASGILDAAPDGSVVLSHSEKSVFSLWYMCYVDRPERDVAIIAAPLLQFDWYLRDIRATFPDRMPAMNADEEPLARIIEHIGGPGRVFLTFGYSLLPEAFELKRVGNLYEVTPK